MGKRPTSSGMKPYSSKSSPITWSNMFSPSTETPSLGLALELKPTVNLSFDRRLSTISLSPSKVPPQRKRISLVLIGTNSWCGCLRPPCGGTFATQPSMIFKRAC